LAKADEWFKAFVFGPNIVALAFSPDGTRFAIAVRGDTPEHQHIAIYDTSKHIDEARQLIIKATADGALGFSADGQALVAVGRGNGDISVRRVRVSDGKWLSSFSLPGTLKYQEIALSPDGKTLARRRHDSFQLEFFDTDTGKPRHERSGMGASISALAFSPDGKLLASSDRYQTRLWDLATARAIATWAEYPYHRVAFSPDGKLLAGASYTGINIHRVADGRRLHRLDPVTTAVESITFSPDGSLFAATGGGNTVRVWRVSDGKEIRVLSYPKKVYCVRFRPDGSKLFVAGDAGIKVWEVLTGLEDKHFLEGEPFYLLEWLPDGKTLLARSGGYILHVDPETGKTVQKQTVPGGVLSRESWYPANTVSPGARLLCETNFNEFVLTQLDPVPERRRTLRLSPSRNGSAAWHATAFSPEGRYLALGGPEGVISLMRLSDRGKLPELQVLAPTARELADRPNAADALEHKNVPAVARAYVGGGVPGQAPKELVGVLGEAAFRCPQPLGAEPHRPAYSPDGKFLAVPSGSRVCLFDAQTGAYLREFGRDSNDPVSQVKFSPDSRVLAVASGEKKQVLALWTLSGKMLGPVFGASVPPLRAFALSPNGKYLAIAGGPQATYEVGIWDVATHEKKSDIVKVGGVIDDLVFSPDSPDGDHLAVVGNEIELWTNVTKKPKFVRELLYGTIVFSPDGRYAAVGRAQGRRTQPAAVALFEKPFEAENKPTQTFSIEDGRFAQLLAFTSDGKQLLAVSTPQVNAKPTLHRWELSTGKDGGAVELSGVSNDAPQLLRGAISPDGRTLALVEWGKVPVLRVLDTTTGKERFPDAGHRTAVTALAWSPDGKQLASADDRTMTVWELATGRLLRSWPWTSARGDNPVLIYSPDGGMLATNGEPAQRPLGASTLAVCRSSDGGRLKSIVSPVGAIKAAAFGPDNWLVIAGPVNLWVTKWDDDKSGRLLRQGEGTRALTFSPDGQFVVTLDTTGAFHLWSVADGQEKRSWQSQGISGPLVFLPDGRSLAGATERGGLAVWDARTGELQRNSPGAEVWGNVVGGIALAPSGRLIAHWDWSGLVLSQPGAGRPQRNFQLGPRVQFDKGGVAAFSPDGRYLAVGDRAGVVSILRLAERGQVPTLPDVEVAPMPRPVARP
jgi:WD40 repeat protein